MAPATCSGFSSASAARNRAPGRTLIRVSAACIFLAPHHNRLSARRFPDQGAAVRQSIASKCSPPLSTGSARRRTRHEASLDLRRPSHCRHCHPFRPAKAPPPARLKPRRRPLPARPSPSPTARRGSKAARATIFTKDGLISRKRSHYPIWRGGANAATTLKTDADLKIGDLMVPKGTYTLFVDISDPDQWDPDRQQEDRRVGPCLRQLAGPWQDVKMKMSKPPSMVEDLKYTITDAGRHQGKLTLEWENHAASVPISVH